MKTTVIIQASARSNGDTNTIVNELKYDTIVFATPVYWYNMSSILKAFFDRLSDLLHYKKELGRQLRGKNMAMISNNNYDDIKEGFSMPFRESANYLGMTYLGNTHAWVEEGKINPVAIDRIDAFRELL